MAVLPFDAVGQDAATSALGLGLMETVAAKLVEASGGDMIQLVSPHELREKGIKNAADARREFGTDLVLEGSLQQSGQKLRITCNLVDSKTGRQIAARTITKNSDDIFGLQDEVVSQTLNMLPAQISLQQRRDLARHPDTKPAAYEAYIRGRGYLQEYEKPENIDSAITEFSQAIKIDANYAPAYAGLGNAYWIGFQQLNRGREWLDKASSNCQKALAAGPQLAEGYVCLGNVSFATGHYEEAVQDYQRALDLDHDSDAALEGLASAYGKLGNASGAEAAYKKAIELRPNYWSAYAYLGEFYFNQARYADAADMFRKMTELAPYNYRGYADLSGAYVAQGRYSEAIDIAKRSVGLRPDKDGSATWGQRISGYTGSPKLLRSSNKPCNLMTGTL